MAAKAAQHTAAMVIALWIFMGASLENRWYHKGEAWGAALGSNQGTQER